MEFEGTLASNLQAAIASAERLRGHPVHKDTLEFWRELLAEARAHKRLSDPNRAEIEGLVAQLQALVVAHEEGV
jgi:hypothetical protein